MTSVQTNDTPCPQCGAMMEGIFDCDSREDWCACPLCGYEYEWARVPDRAAKWNGDNGGRWHYKLRKDGYPVMRSRVSPGYGVSQLTSKKTGIHRVSGHRKMVSEQTMAAWGDMMLDPSVDPDHSYLTSWDPQTKRLTILHGIGAVIELCRETMGHGGLESSMDSLSEEDSDDITIE
jgi:hypothetical protein